MQITDLISQMADFVAAIGKNGPNYNNIWSCRKKFPNGAFWTAYLLLEIGWIMGVADEYLPMNPSGIAPFSNPQVEAGSV